MGSTDTICLDPKDCFDKLINQCIPCADTNRTPRSRNTCSQLTLCYDHLTEQCVPCGERNKKPSGDTACRQLGDCYDPLTEQCVSCSMIHRSTEETTTVPTEASTTVPPQPFLSLDQACTPFGCGVYILAGLVLLVTAVLCLIVLKQQQRSRTRRTKGKSCNTKENENCAVFIENEAPKIHIFLPRDNSMELLENSHSNETPDNTTDAISEEETYSIATGSGAIEMTSLFACDNKLNPTLPLPATELGATVLVTTKTTQENQLP